MKPSTCLVMLLAVAVSPAQASDQAITETGAHCLGEAKTKAILEQTLGFVATPVGVEHQFYLSVCTPLVREPHLLFDHTEAEVGVYNLISPVYSQQGIFGRMAPLSILQLFWEVGFVGIWNIDLEAAGHYELDGYDSPFGDGDLPGPEGTSTSGVTAKAGGTLRILADLGPIEALLLDKIWLQYWGIKSAGYYYNLREDLPLRSQDVVFGNDAILAVGLPLHPNIRLRLGAMDELRAAPQSGTVHNILGGLVALSLKRAGYAIRDLMILARLGVRTKHTTRTGNFHILVAINLYYDLSKKRAKAAPP